jgi:hypothetical protein
MAARTARPTLGCAATRPRGCRTGVVRPVGPVAPGSEEWAQWLSRDTTASPCEAWLRAAQHQRGLRRGEFQLQAAGAARVQWLPFGGDGDVHPNCLNVDSRGHTHCSSKKEQDTGWYIKPGYMNNESGTQFQSSLAMETVEQFP